MLKRRNYPDENICQFEGWISGDIVLSEHVYKDKNVVPRVDFQIASYCNEFSPKAFVPVSLFALKATAVAIHARYKATDKVYVRCVYRPDVAHRGTGKGMTNIESVTPIFEVKKIVLLATKSETLEIVTEEITDMILGREEVKTK